MTDVPKDPPDCSRCGNKMELVASIAPFGDRQGLVAYLCSKCNHTQSFLMPPTRQRRSGSAQSQSRSVAQQQQQQQPQSEDGDKE
jgi:hypothetical protein